jgi:hypothetical protein
MPSVVWQVVTVVALAAVAYIVVDGFLRVLG